MHRAEWRGGDTGRRSGTDGVSPRTSKWDTLQINRTWEGLWALALWRSKRRAGRQQASTRRSTEKQRALEIVWEEGRAGEKCKMQRHWTFREMSKWQQASTTRGVSKASSSIMMRGKPRGKWSEPVTPKIHPKVTSERIDSLTIRASRLFPPRFPPTWCLEPPESHWHSYCS